MPLLIGGSGERFTLAVVARYADIWNGEGDPTTVARKTAVLHEHCKTVGRDPAEIVVTVNVPTPCVRASRAEAIAALSATFRLNGLAPDAAVASAEASPWVGQLEEVIAYLQRYAELGVDEVIFDTPHPIDLQTLTVLSGPIREHFSRLA
jgi:alkanesulfonate monooxygenase SsuD/methylene tetrahydromethanopterin reductase-like flavin-dependent oxidoreductase (luciferase family)